MSELITIQSGETLALPSPRVAISIRLATMDDLGFIDSLQKKTSNMVGFMPTKQLEGKINAGDVLVAESLSPRSHGDTEGRQDSVLNSSSFSVTPCLRGERIGYLIGADRYFKHDDVGIIYAINVVPEYRRSLVAAALLKAQFERSAYGCKLYCCWCAQDLEANRFWESMGFVALAYRAGSETRGKGKTPRVHIFWQKRIRAGDTSTPWWFPSKTTGGSIREDRIVLPMRPGMHWSDAQPIILPGEKDEGGRMKDEAPCALPATRKASRSSFSPQPSALTPTPRMTGAGMFTFASAIVATKAAKPAREKRVKRPTDPKLAAAARELRDRWLEEMNASPMVAGVAKYDVSRAIAHVPSQKLLAA